MYYMVPMVPSDLMLNFFLLVTGAQYFWKAGMDFTMCLVPKGEFLAYLASLMSSISILPLVSQTSHLQPN